MEDLLEIEFVQQPASKQMFVTSNPFFAFHDDVFPAFSKNAVAQPRFPPSFGQSTIIPNKFFSSLAELNHISTFEMKFDGIEKFAFEIVSSEKSPIFEEIKILELSFFDGSTFLSFGASPNYSLWIDSDYFEAPSFLATKINQLSKLKLSFKSSSSTEISLQIIKERLIQKYTLSFFDKNSTRKRIRRKTETYRK